jgi:hypothetical protein
MPQSIDGITKRCGRCNGLKDLDAFSKDARRADGRDSICRSCQEDKHQGITTEPIAVKPNHFAIRTALVEYINSTLDCGKALDEGHINGNMLATNAQKIALKTIDSAVKGDLTATKMILDRLEGLAKQSIEIEASVTSRHEQLVANADELMLKLKSLNLASIEDKTD